MNASRTRSDPAESLARVPLESGSLLLGDVHLDLSPRAAAPAVAERERFLAWLERVEAPRLVVLGDLFDAWVGPAHGRLPAAREVLEALRALTGRGVALEVLHGNRDFLLDGWFERASGARVHAQGLLGLAPDRAPARVRESGAEPERRPWLALHGDELCTRDHAYQRLKRVLRSRPVRLAAPRVPGPLARWVAARLRRASVRAVASKPPEEKLQQREAAERLLERHGARLLVCGHAHRFRDESLGQGRRWLVLDAFGGARDLLRVGPDGMPEPGSALRSPPPGARPEAGD